MNIRHSLTRFLRELQDIFGTYAKTITLYPILLLPLLAVYIGIAIALSVVTTLVIAQLFGYDNIIDSSDRGDYFSITFVLAFGLIALLLAVHYLWFMLLSFLSTATLDGSAGSILRVVQLVFTAAVYFSIIHYYIALFSGPDAYHGLAKIEPKNGWEWPGNWFGRLTFIPSVDMALDCFYFSTVTMATIGYGDIYPVSRVAKIATMVEIFSSFGLIVIVLARVIGRSTTVMHSDSSSQSHPPSFGI